MLSSTPRRRWTQKFCSRFLVSCTLLMATTSFLTSQQQLEYWQVRAFVPTASPFGCTYCCTRIQRISRHSAQVLQQSSSAIDSFESSSSSSPNNNNNMPSKNNNNCRLSVAAEEESVVSAASTRHNDAAILDLPWNDHQRWVLCDKVGRYIIPVVAAAQDSTPAGTSTPNIHRKVYILWRNFVHDTPELQGYPLPFLSERLHDEIRRTRDAIQNKSHETTTPVPSSLSPLLLEQSDELSSTTRATTTTIILPYLDHYRFEPNGGLSGLVYGVPGVADGSRLQTAPVTNVEVTLPQNYVRTTSTILYELGQPAGNSAEPLTLVKNDISTGRSKHWQKDGKELVASMVAMSQSGSSRSNDDDDSNSSIQSILDPELINLAALTAVVVVGAAAVQTLSHHLTVNIFWV